MFCKKDDRVLQFFVCGLDNRFGFWVVNVVFPVGTRETLLKVLLVEHLFDAKVVSWRQQFPLRSTIFEKNDPCIIRGRLFHLGPNVPILANSKPILANLANCSVKITVAGMQHLESDVLQ